MASLVAGTLCRQAHTLRCLSTINQNHFASQSGFVQLCLRTYATKKMGLPRVFFDMTADGAPVGRFIVEVSKNYFWFNFTTTKSVNLPARMQRVCDFEGPQPHRPSV